MVLIQVTPFTAHYSIASEMQAQHKSSKTQHDMCPKSVNTARMAKIRRTPYVPLLKSNSSWRPAETLLWRSWILHANWHFVYFQPRPCIGRER